MESVTRQVGREGNDDVADIDNGSSSDMDFDEFEYKSDPTDDEEKDTFMDSYSEVLNEELKTTTLEKSFFRANEQSSKNDERTSSTHENVDKDFTPVDVDVNLVKCLLDSFSSQQGLPGPASNLLGLMGLQLPRDTNKDKYK